MPLMYQMSGERTIGMSDTNMLFSNTYVCIYCVYYMKMAMK